MIGIRAVLAPVGEHFPSGVRDRCLEDLNCRDLLGRREHCEHPAPCGDPAVLFPGAEQHERRMRHERSCASGSADAGHAPSPRR